MANYSSSTVTFYEAFFDDPSIITRKVDSHTDEVNSLKRPLTLDLNCCNVENSYRKRKFQPSVLTSPDLRMLKFNSPELEQFYLSQQIVQGHISTPTPSLFSMHVADELEMYAQPYVEALNNGLHYNSDSNSGTHVQIPMANSSRFSSEYQSDPQYSVTMPSKADFDTSNIKPHHVIEERPQTLPSVTSSSSPINMESRVNIKLENKRRRNRLASNKCHQRKLDRISELKNKVKILKYENIELTIVLNQLSEQVRQLNQTANEHRHNGCDLAACDQ